METNYRKGEVEVEFGADAKLIRFDLNAMATLEQNLRAPFHEILKSLGYHYVREALFVGLRHKGNKKLTRAKVGDMMASGHEGQDFNYYASCVYEAVQGATGMDLSDAISALRGEDDDDEDDSNEGGDGAVEGVDGPDAGNSQATQLASTGSA